MIVSLSKTKRSLLKTLSYSGELAFSLFDENQDQMICKSFSYTYDMARTYVFIISVELKLGNSNLSKL